MPTTLFALILMILFSASPAVAASGEADDSVSGVQPETPSEAVTPGPTPEVSSKAGPEASEPAESSTQSNARPNVQAPASPGRSHLSSDPRVKTARALVERKRFVEALEILRPLAASEHPDQIDIRFSSPGPVCQPGVSAIRARGRDTSRAPGRGDRRVPVHPDPRAGPRARAPGTGPGLLSEGGRCQLARGHFERALVGRPPEALVANINGFLNVMRARRRWSGYFGFSLAPDTNITAASDADIIYINGLPFRLDQRQVSSGIGIVGWGGGEYQFPLAQRWRLRTGINVNHRDYKGGRFDQTFVWPATWGRASSMSRNTEMSLLASVSQRWWGGSSFNYDYGARLEVLHRVLQCRRAIERPGELVRTGTIPAELKFLEGPLMVFSLGCVLRALPDRAGQRPWWAILKQGYAEAHQLEQCRVLGARRDERRLAVGVYCGCHGAEFRWTNL